MCKACRHLGLECTYRRPVWWGDSKSRAEMKELIKNNIKDTKQQEKVKDVGRVMSSAPTPSPAPESIPGLTPTMMPTLSSSDYSASEWSDATRSTAGSEYSFGDAFYGDDDGLLSDTFPSFNAPMPLYTRSFPIATAPYDMEPKQDQNIYINQMPPPQGEYTPDFSDTQSFPPPPSILPSVNYPDSVWFQDNPYDSRAGSICGSNLSSTGCSTGLDSLDFGRWDYMHDAPNDQQISLPELGYLDENGHPIMNPLQFSGEVSMIAAVAEHDRQYLDHFVHNVSPTLFPIMEHARPGACLTEMILPSLRTNKCFLDCCLTSSAHQMRTVYNLQGAQIDHDIVRLQWNTITVLCEELTQDREHLQILEATLGMIYFPTAVAGSPASPQAVQPYQNTDKDIPWHQHFIAAASLAQKLDLPSLLTQHSGLSRPPFQMTLTAWIDVLGATLLGRSPQFADTYREKHLSVGSCGFKELMGCDDRVMYLISEIACLDSLKTEGRITDLEVCRHVESLGYALGQTESDASSTHSSPPAQLQNEIISSNTANQLPGIDSKHLSRNITTLFRLAARLHLASLVPDFTPTDSGIRGTLDQFAVALSLIPATIVITEQDAAATGSCAGVVDGFERSIVWPLLIAGSMSLPDGLFRQAWTRRMEGMGPVRSKVGSIGWVNIVLAECWHVNDQGGLVGGGGGPRLLGVGAAVVPNGSKGKRWVHWREVMKVHGWDFLLI